MDEITKNIASAIFSRLGHVFEKQFLLKEEKERGGEVEKIQLTS